MQLLLCFTLLFLLGTCFSFHFLSSGMYMFEVELKFRKASSKNYKCFLHFCDSYDDVIEYIDKCMRNLAPKYTVFKFIVKESK